MADRLEAEIRRLVELYDGRDWDSFEDVVHPRFEFHSEIMSMVRGPGSERRVYHGLAGLREWTDDIDDALEDTHIETVAVETLGPEAALELAHLGARGRGSGVPVILDFVRVWEFEDGRVRRIRSYRDVDEGRRAAEELRDAPGEVPGA
jgi:ketosteroid isomerase-like protein